MDKKIAGLLGAVGALASLDTAQATIPTDSTTMLKAQSYADLLNPIPNAAAILKAADEAGDLREFGSPRMPITITTIIITVITCAIGFLKSDTRDI
jgi:hypothetical protein